MIEHRHDCPAWGALRTWLNAWRLVLIAAAWVPAADAAVITVGPGAGHDYATLSAAIAAARPHDEILIAPGLYQNDFATVSIPLTIQGDGGQAILEATVPIPNGKAILVTRADVVIRNVEFRGAKVADQNGAGIRHEAGGLVVENSTFRDNENGILAGTAAGSNIVVRGSTFIDNGYGDGLTHGIYVNRIASLTVDRSTFEGTKAGHDIKSRAETTVITNNYLDDGITGTASYAIDVPNGGAATIIGNVIRQGANTMNSAMVAFGAEGNLHALTSLLVANNTFYNERPGSSVGVYNHTAVAALLQNNTFTGVQTALVGPGEIASGPSLPEPAALGLLGCALIMIAIARHGTAGRTT